jgi:hypothetical protein
MRTDGGTAAGAANEGLVHLKYSNFLRNAHRNCVGYGDIRS